MMYIPRYELEHWTTQLAEYNNTEVSIVDSKRDVASNISRSIHVLNELARAGATYVKAGNASQQVALGIFGSCGRLEMREDSDIECSVYFRGANNRVASTFWNRITRYISANNNWSYKYEGQNDIENSPTGFLLENQAGEKFENKFIAMLDVDRFLAANLDTEPEIRDRHFQILTELRAVFNPDFIFQMKKEMIIQNCETSDLRVIVESAYTRKIFAQYFMDVAPQSLSQWADFKRFCYRTLNVLALQLFFVQRLAVDTDQRLDEGEGWTNLFDSLCDPGILKILQFQKVCKATMPNAQSKALMKDIHALIRQYFYVYSRFVKTKPAEQANLRQAAMQTIDQFALLFDKMKQLEFFRRVVENQFWLFATDKIVELRSQL